MTKKVVSRWWNSFFHGMNAWELIILTGTALLAFTACFAMKINVSGPVKPDQDTVMIQGVPFYPQEDYQCGPASLAGVLNFWKETDTPSAIAEKIFSPSAKATLTLDMQFYAEKKGLTALQYSGGMDDLKSRIREGYPLIVLVDYGFWMYQAHHFMVVIGYTGGNVIVNSGKSEKALISDRDFLKTWQKTTCWTLWVKPK